MKRPLLFLFHTEGINLTLRALESAQPFFDVHLVDNSGKNDFAAIYQRSRTASLLPQLFPIETREFPSLTLSQLHRAAHLYTRAAGADHYYWLHNDALPPRQTCEGLISKVGEILADGARWGALFTHYDAFCAYSLRALDAIGGWSDLFDQYFLDNHTYRLMRLAGFPTIATNLPCHHEASATLRDPRRKARNDLRFPRDEQIYIQVWGGKPGEETYTTPLYR